SRDWSSDVCSSDVDAVAGAGLGQQTADVGLHGRLGDDEGPGDLRIAETPGDETEDLALALGDAREPPLGLQRGPRGRRAGEEVVEQAPGRRRCDDRVAGVDGTDRGEQLRGRGVLEQKGRGARAQRRERILVQVERGQYDDAWSGVAGREPPGG